MSFPFPQPDPDNHIITAQITGGGGGGEGILQINLRPRGFKDTPQKKVCAHPLTFIRKWQHPRGELGLLKSSASQQPGFAPFPVFYSWENCPSLDVCGLKIEGKMGSGGRCGGGG